MGPITCNLCGFEHPVPAPCPTPEVVSLRGAARRAPVRHELVTACCKLTPELLDGVLWCPCGTGYRGLAELVRAKGAA